MRSDVRASRRLSPWRSPWLLVLALAAAASACDRGDSRKPAGGSERRSIEDVLSDARARAPRPADNLETRVRAVIANLRLARRQMVQTTEGEAERLPREVIELSRLGRAVIPLLDPILTDPVPDTRYYALQILADVGDQRELDRFLRALGDDDAGVVRVASEALGRHRNAETLPLIFQALEEGRVRQVRWGSVLKPPKPFDRDQVPYLVRRLTDERPEIRISAAIALNRITGQDFGFDPFATEAERRRAVMRWESWWSSGGRAETTPPAPAAEGTRGGQPRA